MILVKTLKLLLTSIELDLKTSVVLKNKNEYWRPVFSGGQDNVNLNRRQRGPSMKFGHGSLAW